MDSKELSQWFITLKDTLENAYLQHDEPWKQSGFSGPEERWRQVRKPIADCVEESGTFLDIGCANGYLLECLMKWVSERGLSIIPYGLDLSEKLVEIAKGRLPVYKDNLFVGNAWNWESPLKLKYVRTELVYVPEHLQEAYIQRILNKYLEDSGKLLVAGYTSRKFPNIKPRVNQILERWGFSVEKTASGFWNDYEETQIAVISK